MEEIKTVKRSFRDRRGEADRRTGNDLLYRGPERRSFSERRTCAEEKRIGWIRVSQWNSVCVEALR